MYSSPVVVRAAAFVFAAVGIFVCAAAIVALVGFFAWRQVNSSRVQVAGLELDKANVVNERTNTELGLAKVELDRLARQHEFETWEQCNDHWTETGLGTCRQDDNGTPYGVCGDSSKYGPGCQNTCDAPLRIYEFDVADGSVTGCVSTAIIELAAAIAGRTVVRQAAAMRTRLHTDCRLSTVPVPAPSAQPPAPWPP